MFKSGKIVAAFFGVFLIGMVVGAMVGLDYKTVNLAKFLTYANDPDGLAKRINQRMVEHYQLSPDQQKQTAPLVLEMAQNLSQIKQKFGADTLRVMQAYHDKIRLVLTPEQQAAYDQANAERAARLSEELGLPPAPPEKPKP